MWTYVQSSGEMIDAAGEVIAVGYSGHGAERNKPALESVSDLGPMPKGLYRIVAMWESTAAHGPYVLLLGQIEGESFGRSLFLIHGDNAAHDASQGCIVLPREARLRIAASEDRDLRVVAYV